jgi:hypothetical protein
VIWLFRSIRFTHQLGQGQDGELRQRVQHLAERLLALEAEDPSHEVWLVGHSSGSLLLVMLAAELRRRQASRALQARLQLLSLGQNLANLAVYPGAQRFRSDLLELAQGPRLPWLDLTCPDDYLCFAGVDPYRSAGLPSPIGQPFPELRQIELAAGRGVRHRWQLLTCQFDLHFDYWRSRLDGFDLLALLLPATAVAAPLR